MSGATWLAIGALIATATPGRVHLSITECPDVDTREVKRLLQIELKAEIIDLPPQPSTLPLASIRCDASRATLTFQRNKRTIDLSKVDPRARTRLLALALAELAAPKPARKAPIDAHAQAPASKAPIDAHAQAPPHAPVDTPDIPPRAYEPPALEETPPIESPPTTPAPGSPRALDGARDATDPALRGGATDASGAAPDARGSIEGAPRDADPNARGSIEGAPRDADPNALGSTRPGSLGVVDPYARGSDLVDPSVRGAASTKSLGSAQPVAKVDPSGRGAGGAKSAQPGSLAVVEPSVRGAGTNPRDSAKSLDSAQPVAPRDADPSAAAADEAIEGEPPAVTAERATTSTGGFALHFAASVLGGLTLFTAAGPPAFGGQVAIELAPSVFGARLDAGAYFGSERVDQGDVSLLIAAGGLSGFGRFTTDIAVFDIAAGARVGFARVRGTPGNPSSVDGATVSGAWAGPFLGGRATFLVGPIQILADLEAGLVIRPVVGQAAGAPVAAADGAWFGFRLGLGLEP